MPTPYRDSTFAYAATFDVADGWRDLTEDEEAQARTRLDRASIIVDAEFPHLRAAITAGAERRGVTMVVAEMVRRSLLAPAEGYDVAGAASSGPATYVQPQGNLYLTKTDRSVLSSVAGRSPRVRSVVLRSSWSA